jgi:hypothetical protein
MGLEALNRMWHMNLYEQVMQSYDLVIGLGGTYIVDTNIILQALDEKPSVHRYCWIRLDTKELRRWFASESITVPHPVIEELNRNGVWMRRREDLRTLLNRSNIRFLINDNLNQYEWKQTLSAYVPETVRELGKYIGTRISGSDARIIAIADAEEDVITSTDRALMEIAYKLDVPIHDFRINPDLP